MCGQLDGQPICGNRPTSEWQPGQIIVDPYRIPIKSDATLGPVPLTMGMYDWATMKRLPVMTPDGSDAGDTIYLTDVTEPWVRFPNRRRSRRNRKTVRKSGSTWCVRDLTKTVIESKAGAPATGSRAF